LRGAAQAAAPFDSLIVDFDFDRERQADFVKQFGAEQDASRTRLILLQDFRHRGARITDGAVTVDANPLVRHRIVTAIAVAAGRASPEVRLEEQEQPTGSVQLPTVEEARACGALILLAEDNKTNQEVIRRQLHRVGYQCEIAGNGVEALQHWQKNRYGLILTDCHMPEMDGYELTARIRSEEAGSGARIPILAITANALQGEAERCLAAGMDDYLIKPVTLKALRAALLKWMPIAHPADQPETSRADADHAQTPQAEVAGSACLEERVLKDMFGDDAATFLEILATFVEPSATIMQALAAACEAHDSEAVKQAAHQLKSSARAIGANPLADSCAELEAAGRAADWSAIDRLHPHAHRQMQELLCYIEGLQKPRTADLAQKTTAGE
jgi:CheY-like chemotaxis protein